MSDRDAGDDGTERTVHELDARTVERIAAGEVVERPASAVKELVENALDADADRITVAVEAGGKESIRVSDDGVGMSEADVRAAVREHTTSKIRDIDDLEAGVGSLGFRGEALHAIGAVSRLAITTKPTDAGRGTELVVEGGEVVSVRPAGCPVGTTVEVTDLFSNVPARRKFLSQDGTEFAHVNRVVTGYALAEPDVAVTLEHGDREVFSTSGRGDLRETLLSVYGREVAQAMQAVDADGSLPEGSLEAVSGMVSHPETTRAGSEYVSTYVNGRYVTAGAVREAAVEAYGDQLAPDRYPFAVLFLEVPPETVDVNVHPRKREVRFADETGVRDQVRAAVRETLLEAGLVRSSAPRGRSAPDQTRIAPGSDGPGDGGVESDEAGTDAENGTDLEARRDADPHTDAGAADDGGHTGAASHRRPDPGGASGSAASADDGGTARNAGAAPRTSGSADPDRSARTPSDGSAGTASTAETGPGEAGASSAGDSAEPSAERSGTSPDPARDSAATEAPPQPPASDPDEAPGSRFRATTQRTLDGETTATERSFDRLPSLRVLGQFRETYLVAETADGLVLIDQHAADERVNYERLRDRLSGDGTTQMLAQPVDLELTAGEAALFEEYADALENLGFYAAREDERTVVVRTVPAAIADAADPSLLRDVLSAFVADGRPGETVESAADALLADLACYPSVTGNTSLTEGSAIDLLEALDDCENPYACPHGRPVVVEFDDDEIGDRFERDYPGHAGRRDH